MVEHRVHRLQLAALGAAVYLGAAVAHAQAQEPEGRWYLEAGRTPDGGPHTQTFSAGVLVPSSLLGGVPRQAGPLTLHWDLWVSHWRAPAQRGRSGLTQLGGAAIWRHALGGQSAPWFVDLGIGAGLMDRLYTTPHKRFSTTFQFTEVVALGFRFGEGQRQEISLRYQHFSNGGIKRPNPGQDIVRVRWAAHF